MPFILYGYPHHPRDLSHTRFLLISRVIKGKLNTIEIVVPVFSDQLPVYVSNLVWDDRRSGFG